MDRRYAQNRTYGGFRASGRPEARREAYARAAAVRGRRLAASMARPTNEYEPKSIDRYTGAAVATARAGEQAERQEIFNQAGSGEFGAKRSFSDAARKGLDLGSGLLPGR